MTTDTDEIDDHLADRETLIVYMTKHEEQSITIDGNLLTMGRCTRILQDSYDFRPVHKRQVKKGERLTVSASIGGDLKLGQLLQTGLLQKLKPTSQKTRYQVLEKS